MRLPAPSDVYLRNPFNFTLGICDARALYGPEHRCDVCTSVEVACAFAAAGTPELMQLVHDEAPNQTGERFAWRLLACVPRLLHCGVCGWELRAAWEFIEDPAVTPDRVERHAYPGTRVLPVIPERLRFAGQPA